VRWCLKWALATLPPLSSQSAAGRIVAWDVLSRLRTRGEPTTTAPPHETAIEETHASLRACTQALAQGVRYDMYVPEGVWSFNPPPPRGGARQSYVITRTLSGGAATHTAALVVSAFLDDLNAMGADRLRACPFKPDGLDSDGPICGVIFLAVRGQRFCSRKHSAAAAWQRFEPKRKGGRK
jgi:hypothetical protein